jgi:hypothetical protein
LLRRLHTIFIEPQKATDKIKPQKGTKSTKNIFQPRRPPNLQNQRRPFLQESRKQSYVSFCAFLWRLSGAGGARGGFDQALNNLGDLGEGFWFSEKCISAATSRFILDFGRTVSRQNDNASLRVVFPDQTDHVETIMIVRHREAEILDYDFVVCGV